MRLRILLIALISTALAQQQRPRSAQRSARTSQIRYQDPSGLKVDWKLFAPQTQWRAHLEQSQRSQRHPPNHPQQPAYQQPQPQPQLVQTHAEEHIHSNPAQLQYRAYQPQAPVHPQPDSNQVHYAAYQAQPSAQPQLESNQVQYKDYQAQASAQPQLESNQAQYRVYPQAQVPVEAQPENNQIQYKTHSDAPSNAKQLVSENLKSQRPYVDPSAFIYTSNFATSQQHDQQPATAEYPQYEQPSESYEPAEQQKARREYTDRGLQGRIVYKNEYEHQAQPQEPQVEHVPVPFERVPIPPSPKLILDKNMPAEIRQLLEYQAQIPYDVIANSISYKPKTLFIPESLPEDSTGRYKYRSKVYYVNNEQYNNDFETTKPVQEDQRH